jgi:hypothetical protein
VLQWDQPPFAPDYAPVLGFRILMDRVGAEEYVELEVSASSMEYGLLVQAHSPPGAITLLCHQCSGILNQMLCTATKFAAQTISVRFVVVAA